MIIATLAVAAVVTVFRSPLEALHLVELPGTMIGVLKLLAGAKGIHA